MLSTIINHLSDSITVQKVILENKTLLEMITHASRMCIQTFRNRRKILLAGNGGSAANSQHLAAEFVNRFQIERPGLPCIALTTDTSIITSIGNDCGFDKIFSRQISTLADKGDLCILFSTSGNSPDIIEALKTCGEIGIATVGLTGSKGGNMKDLCDCCIKVPSESVPVIQELHLMISHILCTIIEENLYGNNPG